MYDLCQLANWLKLRPSELMELRTEGYSPAQCLDFDQACASFWHYVENRREQQVKAKLRAEDKLGKNETWKPKYASDQEILRTYYPEDFATPLDPVVQAMTPADLEAILDTWDPYAEEDAT